MNQTKTKNVEDELTLPPDADSNLKRIRANGFCSNCNAYRAFCTSQTELCGGLWVCEDCEDSPTAAFLRGDQR